MGIAGPTDSYMGMYLEELHRPEHGLLPCIW